MRTQLASYRKTVGSRLDGSSWRAYIMRVGGARILRLEFQISFAAVAVAPLMYRLSDGLLYQVDETQGEEVPG